MTSETAARDAFFEVSAEWMAACGKGNSAKVFPVVRSWMARHLPFVTLDMGNGHTWDVCAEWRGRFI